MRLQLSGSITRFGRAVLLASLVACGEPVKPEPMTTPMADLQATVSGTGTTAVGSEVTYTVRVTNLGPDAASQVDISATLSGAFDVVSVSDGGEIANGKVTWPTVASIESGAAAQYTIVIQATDAGTISAMVTATSETDDPAVGNNDGSADGATVETEASFVADLRIGSDLPLSADGGDTITVTLTASNFGPSSATDVVVTDHLPAGTVVTSISDGGAQDGDQVTWPAVATLAKGDSVAYEVTYVVPAVGPISTLHGVAGSSSDPAAANNSLTVQTLITATPLLMIPGNLVGEQFGWEIERVGDLDGDGSADLAVSAPFGSGNGTGSGRIYIYSGADGALIRQFDGEAQERLGIDMDASTDLDGDGIPELIVGAPGAGMGTTAGRVYIYSLADGSTIKTLDGENTDDRFGWSAAAAGDVNNDDVIDLYVGARDGDVAGTNSGRAYIYSGTDWSVLWTIDGESPGDHFGQAGGGVGDLNTDGFDDFAIGAPNFGPTGNPGRGRLYVYSGATGQSLYTPIDADPAIGIDFGSFWVFSPGDLNSDGTPDIYASDILNNALGTATGRAYVFSGTDASPLLTLTGEAAGDQYGIGHPAGDLDGDGVTDLIIAAWKNSEGANQAGKVYLISGATGETLRTITSTIANENFGFDAFVIGDMNGDGIPDIAISGGISGSTTGHVKIYAGLVP